MAVTIYRSTDTGAPQIPTSSSYDGASFVMDVLKQCLVSGYGSKAAAGWTLDYEDTTAQKRRLGLSNGNGVLEIVTWGSNGLGMFIWDSITTPGVGAIGDDLWDDVVSTGVNGWKDKLIPAPGAESEYLASIYTTYFSDTYAADIAWTVYADDKSAWMLFHYPDGHADAEPADAIEKATYKHPQLFIGAVKSPDLTRAQAGNFFLGYGGRSAGTSSPSSGSSHYLDRIWGLRTPMDTVPSTGNSSDFDVVVWELTTGYHANPYSSVRWTTPLVVNYDGADVPKPAGLSASYDDYQFATLPGIAQFSMHGTGDAYGFWKLYTTEFSSTWNLEPHTIGGVTWMPWSLKSSSAFNNFAITDNADWWT